MYKTILPSGSLYIIFLYCLFFIFTSLLIYNFKIIISFLKTIPKKGVFPLIFVLITALFLRIFIVHHTMFYDESIYINVAQNMYYHHQYGGTLEGSKDRPEIIAPYNRPGGHSFLINLFYLFFGESKKSAFLMNSLLGTLSVVTIFLFSYALFKSITISFFASLFVNIFPIYLVYSGSISSEISSFFFISLSLFILVLFIRFNETSLLYLLIATASSSFYIRPENTLFLIPLIVFFIFLVRDGKLPRKQFWNLMYFLFALVLPLLSKFAVEKLEITDPWSLGLLWEHLSDNIRYLFNDVSTPLLYTIFSLFGAYFLYKTSRKIFFCFLIWFMVFFIAYSGYFAGIFSNSNYNGNRYFFMCILPLCIFASFGVKHLLDKCGRRYKLFIYGLLLTAFVLDSLAVTKRVYGQILDSPRSKEYFSVRDFGRNIPGSEYILTIEPYFVVVELNKKAMDWRIYKNPDFFYKKIILLKMMTWEENSFLKEEKLLKNFYDFKILFQKEFSPGTRTFIAELTKKNLL